MAYADQASGRKNNHQWNLEVTTMVIPSLLFFHFTYNDNIVHKMHGIVFLRCWLNMRGIENTYAEPILSAPTYLNF